MFIVGRVLDPQTIEVKQQWSIHGSAGYKVRVTGLEHVGAKEEVFFYAIAVLEELLVGKTVELRSPGKVIKNGFGNVLEAEVYLKEINIVSYAYWTMQVPREKKESKWSSIKRFFGLC